MISLLLTLIVALEYGKLSTIQVKGRSREVYCIKKDRVYNNATLIFYFHGTSQKPTDFLKSYWYKHLPTNTIVCAPKSDIGETLFEWHLVLTDEQDDLFLMDAILAQLKNSINKDKIQLIGFSAGGIHAAHAAFLRSNYLQSVVIFSGGLLMEQNYNVTSIPTTLVYNGGTDDSVAIVSFMTASNRFVSEAMHHNSKIYTCEHKKGHKIPDAAAKNALSFLKRDSTREIKLKGCSFRESSISGNKEALKESSNISSSSSTFASVSLLILALFQ